MRYPGWRPHLLDGTSKARLSHEEAQNVAAALSYLAAASEQVEHAMDACKLVETADDTPARRFGQRMVRHLRDLRRRVYFAERVLEALQARVAKAAKAVQQ